MTWLDSLFDEERLQEISLAAERCQGREEGLEAGLKAGRKEGLGAGIMYVADGLIQEGARDPERLARLTGLSLNDVVYRLETGKWRSAVQTA